MEKKNHKSYLSPSAFKRLTECSASQVAIDLGEWKVEATKPMLIGSYVDAYFSGTLEQFKNDNPQILKKDGNLYSDFVLAETVIKVIENDPLLLKYVKGDVLQKEILVEINGVMWKGFIDSLHLGKAIVDLKVVADLYTKVWDNKLRQYIHFIEAYKYDLQGAIYQKGVEIETGEKLPFFLAMVTKQNPSDKAVIQIPNDRMDYIIDDIAEQSKELVAIRSGLKRPVRCEKCEYCRATKKLKKTQSIFDFMDF